jgi:hypothetical protein
MSLTKLAAASLALLTVAGLALHVGCSSDPEPECTSNSGCKSATTVCTLGVCKDGKCEAQPVADGTRVADQTAVQGKYCVKLECRAGKPTEVNDTTKLPPTIACQQQECVDMAPKVTVLGDGVPCESSMGTCQGGMCVLNDSGPIGPTDTGDDTSSSEVGDDASGDTETDAVAD